MATKKHIGVPDEGNAKDKYDNSVRIKSRAPDNITPVILQDGTLEVEQLTERASDGFGYQISEKGDSYFFAKKLDNNTECQLIPKSVEKVYKTKASFKGDVKAAFAVFKNDVRKFAYKELGRYKNARKALKKEIDKIEKNKNQFLFTEQRDGALWNQIYIDSTLFGPYNHDVTLEVTKNIEMINDLLVIRTGSFMWHPGVKGGGTFTGPSGFGIAWVSPHNTLVYSGRGLYLSSGIRTYDPYPSGTHSGVTFLGRNFGVVNQYPSHALSSKFITIPVGQKLHSGLTFEYYSDRGGTTLAQDEDPLWQNFYYSYKEYQDNFALNGFDGTIPSGIPFSIETWSTNPRYVGFDGEISVKPVDETIASDISVSSETEGVGVSKDYQASVRLAIKKAKQKFYKKLNKILIEKGIRPKPKRMSKYELLLQRVAQNAYDGLSMIRNEQTAKEQGLESNPLSTPIYYDGTSKMYGGDHSNALYNHNDTKAHRNNGGGTSGTGSSGGGGGTSY